MMVYIVMIELNMDISVTARRNSIAVARIDPAFLLLYCYEEVKRRNGASLLDACVPQRGGGARTTRRLSQSPVIGSSVPWLHTSSPSPARRDYFIDDWMITNVNILVHNDTSVFHDDLDDLLTIYPPGKKGVPPAM
jgi:hypothetical protein